MILSFNALPPFVKYYTKKIYLSQEKCLTILPESYIIVPESRERRRTG
nr:MAG TPA: hypothetical protein [Caudoviricetes sp.]